jgi:hypothetical protein
MSNPAYEAEINPTWFQFPGGWFDLVCPGDFSAKAEIYRSAMQMAS